jgi:hypothetical protein
MRLLLRGLPVALIAATSVIPLFAAEPPIEVGVPIKELISAMRNEDLDWDGTPAGIMPHVSGATTLVGRYGTAAIDLMFATLDDPDRFVSAHFLLTCLVLDMTPQDGGHWDVLHVELFADGSQQIDPAQRTMLKKVWAERLKAQRMKGPAKAQLTLKSTVKIPIKDLAKTITNRDVQWDMTFFGLRPRLTGTSALVVSHWRAEMTGGLLSALDDPERFVAAHVLLSNELRTSVNTNGDKYDELSVAMPAKGPAKIDRAQQDRIKKLWAARLKQPADKSQFR